MAAVVPTYHVLGAGAMGCLVAASLARSSLRVALMTRPTPCEPKPAASKQGLIRVVETYRARDDAAPPSFEARVDVEENDPQAARAEGLPPIARLLVLTKAYDALQALRDLAPRLSPESVVVLLPNGMGHYEEIKAEPRLQHVTRWLLGTTTHGALLLPPPSPSSAAAPASSTDDYHVSHTGRGETFLGLPPLALLAAPADSLAALQTILSELPAASKDALGLVVDADETRTADASAHAMGRRLWMKLAVNSCINPLTALIRRRNGAVASDASLQPLVAAICAEAAAVASASSPASPPSSASLPDAAELEAYVRQVAEQTALNESSMLRDVLHGRRTEIDYINGYIVREARRLNGQGRGGELNVPTHETLVRLIQAAERRDGGVGEGRGIKYRI